MATMWVQKQKLEPKKATQLGCEWEVGREVGVDDGDPVKAMTEYEKSMPMIEVANIVQ